MRPLERITKTEKQKQSLKDAEGRKNWVKDRKAKFAERLGDLTDCNCTPSQYEAFLWVQELEVSQSVAADMMGVSQKTVSKKLGKLFEDYPTLKTPSHKWQYSPDPTPAKSAMSKAKDSDDSQDKITQFFQTGGYHTGGTWWPAEQNGQRLRAKWRREYPD